MPPFFARPHAVATAALALLCLGASTAHASVVTVLPADIANSQQANAWFRANTAGGATAAVTANHLPASGHTGAAEFNSPGNTGKIDLQYQWGASANASVTAAATNGYTLGNLSALSYDWMRASGTAYGSVAPALRLLYDLDGNAATTNDRGSLVWEAVYNSTAIVDGAWNSSDIFGGNFWQITQPSSVQINIYNYTLADWMDVSKSKTESAGSGGSTGDTLTSSTVIYGFNVGIGSGWGGTFNGAVDNVAWGFNGTTTVSNFELRGSPIPEPASLALVGLALLGLAAHRRRAA